MILKLNMIRKHTQDSNTPDSPGNHWQNEGELENPAKRPHTENTARTARPNGGETDTENDYTTQNWTQHTHTTGQ